MAEYFLTIIINWPFIKKNEGMVGMGKNIHDSFCHCYFLTKFVMAEHISDKQHINKIICMVHCSP